MVLFSILFIEPYYTSPKNVITNTIPLILVFLSIEQDFLYKQAWITIFLWLVMLLILSIIPLAIENKNKSPDSIVNRISEILKKLVVFIGKGKIIYSSIFLFFLFYNIKSNGVDGIFDSYFIFLIIIWWLVLLIDPNELTNTFSFKKEKINKDAIWEIFWVQSKKIFLVKLFDDRKGIKRFDVIKFRYSMQDDNDHTFNGIVFDTYLLNQEKWAKILHLSDTNSNNSSLDKNIAYKISAKPEKDRLENEMRVNDFVWIVTDGSGIWKIRFEYSKLQDNLQEWDLLELEVGIDWDKKRLFYQVVSGSTEKEKLEARNENGFIEWEAIQLGEWISEKLSFQKFWWLPGINTPIFIANTANIEIQDFSYPEYKLWVIPNTTLPSVINLHDAVSHHMALLWVTGSWKSFLAREIIKELNSNDTKVICIDFNNEFTQELNPAPESIISEDESKKIFIEIEKLNIELAKFENTQNQSLIKTYRLNIYNYFKAEIKKFLESNDKKIKIFELPEISNNRNSLDYMRYFFDSLFKLVKEYQGTEDAKKICVVLEEAHTIIPEWSFAWSSDKTSQSLVNNIGQIALQGRKYGIWFLVIAQRTANVSKTILTQCNTVICFQAFDDTSIWFLGNYIGKDLVQALPNLKQHHAIVTGKAIKSNVPMIINLYKDIST
jgi:hypothetical protein